MAARDKKQCPLRFHAEEFDRIQRKCKEEDVNYQQLGEVLLGAFLKNNKECMRLVRKFAKSKRGDKKNLNELEKDELFRLLENNSPLNEVGI